MSFNHEKYAHYLEGLDYDEDRVREILTLLYQICDEFTDIGLGIHSVQHVLNIRETITGDDNQTMLPSLSDDANRAFDASKNDAHCAHNTIYDDEDDHAATCHNLLPGI